LVWIVEYLPKAEKDLRKLDKSIQQEITDYMEKRIVASGSPEQFGKPLRYDKAGLWRYRVRDYRIVCQLQGRKMVVLVIAVGHRKGIYD
jgi:mRNA interferase RelE/StbE